MCAVLCVDEALGRHNQFYLLTMQHFVNKFWVSLLELVAMQFHWMF